LGLGLYLGRCPRLVCIAPLGLRKRGRSPIYGPLFIGILLLCGGEWGEKRLALTMCGVVYRRFVWDVARSFAALRMTRRCAVALRVYERVIRTFELRSQDRRWGAKLHNLLHTTHHPHDCSVRNPVQVVWTLRRPYNRGLCFALYLYIHDERCRSSCVFSFQQNKGSFQHRRGFSQHRRGVF
jgi:hypothetical protein